MKSGPRMVFHYSSRHEKTLPDGSIRRRVELLRASLARLQRIRTAQDPQSSDWQSALYAFALLLACDFLVPLTKFWWVVLLLGVAAPIALAVLSRGTARVEKPRFGIDSTNR
jgi:hypothetical protein